MSELLPTHMVAIGTASVSILHIPDQILQTPSMSRLPLLGSLIHPPHHLRAPHLENYPEGLLLIEVQVSTIFTGAEAGEKMQSLTRQVVMNFVISSYEGR